MTINSFTVIRMSGLFSKLKNKVAFKVNQAVEDPEAQKYAKDQEKEKNKEIIPRVKSIEEIRKERMDELKKTKGFSEKVDELMKQIGESAVKKYASEGKSEKEANEQGVKFVFETIIPLLNKTLDDNSSADKILSILEDELDRLTDTSDPNTISPSRIAKKFWRYLKLFIEKAFVPFLAIILSMYVANEAIVYPAPIRTIFFTITFLFCIMYSPVAIGLGLFYLAKKGYSYYVNEITGKEKKRIMPTIFAMLPITTYQPEGGLESFFLYPFTYPKSKQDEEELPKIMKEYQNALDASFPYLEKIKGLPFVVEGLELIKKNMDALHESKEEVKEMSAPVLDITNNTRNKFNTLTTTQLPPTISQTSPPSNNKQGANQVRSPVNNKGSTNEVVPSPVPAPSLNNKKPTNEAPKIDNKENKKEPENQTTNIPPSLNAKESVNQIAPPPFSNNESQLSSPPIEPPLPSNLIATSTDTSQK